jgi:hypothetical protein
MVLEQLSIGIEHMVPTHGPDKGIVALSVKEERFWYANDFTPQFNQEHSKRNMFEPCRDRTEAFRPLKENGEVWGGSLAIKRTRGADPSLADICYAPGFLGPGETRQQGYYLQKLPSTKTPIILRFAPGTSRLL